MPEPFQDFLDIKSPVDFSGSWPMMREEVRYCSPKHMTNFVWSDLSRRCQRALKKWKREHTIHNIVDSSVNRDDADQCCNVFLLSRNRRITKNKTTIITLGMLWLFSQEPQLGKYHLWSVPVYWLLWDSQVIGCTPVFHQVRYRVVSFSIDLVTLFVHSEKSLHVKWWYVFVIYNSIYCHKDF